MKQRFGELWSRTIADANSAEVWRCLDSLYREPGRAYHNWSHIEAMLANCDATRADASLDSIFFDRVELAIFFHDAIYVPVQHDNEMRSADLFEQFAGRSATLGADAVAHVCEMIRATHKHLPSSDPATQLLLDLDLAVLGGSEDDYSRYVAAVRLEYATVSDDAWRDGRAAVMARFLERPRLYQTDTFFARLETGARRNISGEIARLRAGQDI